MKVSVVQQDIIWGDPVSNRSHLDSVLPKYSDSDLIVLPEMFTTGFATMPDAVVEESIDDTLGWMRCKARELDLAIVGSIALRLPEGKLVNRMLFVKPDGTYTIYDKHHLFKMGGEHLRFNSGDERVIVEWRGVRFLLLICYDLRFPVWARSRGDYDAIVIGADWPEPRRYAWQTLIRARAIENQAYVLAANRGGKDPICVYTGDSAILGPWGEVLAEAEPYVEGVISAEIDMAKIEKFRKEFAALEDADNFKFV